MASAPTDPISGVAPYLKLFQRQTPLLLRIPLVQHPDPLSFPPNQRRACPPQHLHGHEGFVAVVTGVGGRYRKAIYDRYEACPLSR